MLRKKIARRIMAGMLGLACLFAGATSQARTLVNGISVQCITQNEVGEDEIFLKFNTNRLNMGNFVNGRTTASATTYIFTPTTVNAELWESDGAHWYDGDDLWDSHAFATNGSWTWQSTLINDGQSHNYKVFFTMSFTP